uniref:FERM and PDZ domain-containing protein 1 n=1 Tax=Ornithorhynchus anatinus TaxID=9258 RepID=A0A6I8NPE5_ORNAN
MEDQEPGSFQTRKAHRIEQMVARWLRRSRDNSPRISVGDGPPGGLSQALTSVKLTVKIYKDVLLSDFGFHISQSLPLTVTSVIAGGTADGKLLPGDQILKMNNASVEDLSCEQAADILRESEESLLITLLRCPSGVPKSSFLTEEKRARLKINPVKVHFAEEVLVNGHSQGNSLLCMPNVLKVYLENGQTKAFKFEKNTSVKDIILTLKEKLSIHSIEYFALVLEEQYNISKLHLLHEDELIEQVVQKKESYDYRCLFRVCFVPKDPLDLLQDDPVAFEYLYLQSCSDVLQERFAVEMKCSSALRLAALHIQERIYACAQPQKISLKYIEKDWGIENFISPTLLRNMRGKDIKKAISFHMKRNQSLLEPRQKQLISAAQLRLNYLQILGELKTYGGKIFNATLMLQDRESYIALLVGAKYGISQIINSKLNIMSTLAEFANISKIDLTEESEKVSMVKVYLQDVKLLTLLLESNSAKDLACLIAGYYRLFVHSAASIFIWPGKKQQTHRISAEEGYESRTCSDSEESSEVDSSLEILSDGHLAKFGRVKSPSKEDKGCEVLRGQSEDSSQSKEEKRGLNSETSAVTDSASEASDSANTESRGCKTSGSSDSMDALEEDDLDACSSSRPEFFRFYTPTFKERLDQDSRLLTADGGEEKDRVEADGFLCLLELAQGANSGAPKTAPTRSPSDPKHSSEREPNVLTLDPRFYDNSRMEYYSLCSSVSPPSLLSHSSESNSSRNVSPKSVQEETVRRTDPGPVVDSPLLNLPVGFEDTSSDDEFYDAADKLTPPNALSDPYTVSTKDQDDFCLKNKARSHNVGGSLTPRPNKTESDRREEVKKYAKTLRKRRSFLQTDYTSQVTFPLAPSFSLESVDHVCCYEREPYLSFVSHSPTVSSLQDTQAEPALLETKALAFLTPLREVKSKTPSSSLMEMEPETMETKSVTDSIISPISAVRLKVDPERRDGAGVPPVTTNGARNHIHPPLSSRAFGRDAHPSPSEASFRVQSGKAGVTQGPAGGTQDRSPNLLLKTRESWVSSAGRVVVTPGDTVVLTTGDRLESGFGHGSEMQRQEAVRKYMEPVSSPGGQSGSGGPPGVTPLPTGVTKPNGNVLFKEMAGSDSSQNEEDKKRLGSSKVTELLFDRNDPPWPALGPKPERASPPQQTDPQEEGRQEAPRIASPQVIQAPGKGPLTEGRLASDLLIGVQGLPSALPMPFREGSSVAERPFDSEGKSRGDLRKAVPRVGPNPGQAQPNPPLCIIEETSRQMKGHALKEWHCSDYFSTGCGNTSETREENLTLMSPSSDQSLLGSGPENSPGVPVNHRAGSSLDFSDMKEAILPTMEVEKCSCQLSYATCFRSPDAEADDENADLGAGGSPAPLTTPPSSGNPIPVDLKSSELTRVRNPKPHLSENCPWPDYYSRALHQLKVRLCKYPVGFCQLLDNTVELQRLLEQFRAPGNKHSQDECAWHSSENRNNLCVAAQKLMSSCQHVIKIDQSPEETRRALQDTFRNLLQLTGVYFQFTDCGNCAERHGDVTGHLKEVICTYSQFVQAAKLTCERGYRDLSAKLLARQCTALTAAVFCLTQRFQGSAAL